MAGPSPHQWLGAVTRRVTQLDHDLMLVDGDDWRSLVRLARQALNQSEDHVDPPASGDWEVYRDPSYKRAQEREAWERAYR